MKQVSSPPEPWRPLAPAILRVRAAAYAVLAALVITAWLVNGEPAVPVVSALLLAALVPFLRRGVDARHQVEIAVGIDILIATFAWWEVPGDPVLPLAITLWAVAVGAFFCSTRLERVLLAMIVVLEITKLPLAAAVFPDQFAQDSFFREMFTSEWIVQLALTAGRLIIILATYFLFRAISDLYRTSQARVEENEIRFRTLVETSPNAILVIRDDVIVFVNSTTPGVLGAEHSQLIGRHVYRHIPDDHHEWAAEVLADTQVNGSIHRLENMPMQRLDDGTRIVDLTLAPTLYQGNPAVQIVVQDVTERFEADQVLAASEARYREFFEELPVALYRTAPDGRILDANREMVRLLGVDDASELVDRMASSFYANVEDRLEFSQSIEDEGAVVGHEIEVRQAKGNPIWVRDSARILDTAEGVIYEGALIDVTERRSAEAEVRRRADQQEAVARIGHMALTGASLADVFRAASDTMKQQLEADVTGVLCLLEDGSFALEAGTGWPTERPGTLIVPPSATSHHQYVVSSDRAVLITDLATETRFEPSPALLGHGARTGSSVPIRGPDGPLGMMGAFRKTSRTFTDEDIHFLESLANIVGAAIQRQKAAEQLEELVRSKDQFVAAVSHEVRTPLTVVSGLAEELHDRWDQFTPAEVEELIALLVNQSREMSDLIEDLLVSARADIGKVKIRPEPVRLDEHVTAVLEPLASDESDRIEVSASPAIALADPVRLRQIIRNLVTNAIRYGGPTITICVGNGGQTSFLEVRDNGEAIADGDRDKIFEPYHRAHEFTGRTASVGLGLAVSRTLAELMHGTLTYSHNGESVFRLTLPAV